MQPSPYLQRSFKLNLDTPNYLDFLKGMSYNLTLFLKFYFVSILGYNSPFTVANRLINVIEAILSCTISYLLGIALSFHSFMFIIDPYIHSNISLAQLCTWLC